MRSNRRLGGTLKHPCVAIIFWLGLTAAAAPCESAEVWLAGVDPYVRTQSFHETSDYAQLFDDNSDWKRAAQSVRFFKISTQYLAQASDDDLEKLIIGLRKRGIKLAVEGLMIPQRGSCGAGVEGYSAPGTIAAVAQQIKRLGGAIDAVAMDEPARFGSYYRGAHACSSSLDAVASAVAENVRAIRQIFPDVKIGDIEPFGGKNEGTWPDSIEAFAHAYQKATGRPLDFFDADLDWNGPWHEALLDMARRMRKLGIRFGIIYNGDPDDASDQAWTGHALARANEIEGELGLVPDRAILQTWMRYPLRMLPEGQPGTMTNLVLNYTLPIPALTAQLIGNKLVGRLAMAPDRPLPGRSLTMSVKMRSPIPVQQEIDGVVPDGAVQALIGLRLNVECDCSGTLDGLMGPLTYRDGGSQQSVNIELADSAAAIKSPVSDKGFVRLSIQPGQQSLINGKSFTVRSRSAFALSFAAGVGTDSRDAGYLCLIFLDQAGKELARREFPLAPTEAPLGKIRTREDGRFSFQLPASVVDPRELRVAFLGDAEFRAARKMIIVPSNKLK
jgi:hypothetical protein